MHRINGEGNVKTDKLSRNHQPIKMRKAKEIVKVAGELELDSEADDESHSESEAEFGGYFQEAVSRIVSSSNSESKCRVGI